MATALRKEAQIGDPLPIFTRLLYTAYSFGIELVTWAVLVPWTLVQVFLKQASWPGLAQRLGGARFTDQKTGPRILIHAVSVGEMAAAAVLIGALARLIPGIQVILTSGNRLGLEAGRRIQLRHEQVREVWLLPWDRRRPLLRWLDALSPDLVAVVETELWPNLFLTCRELRIPLCLVNGRIYPRDVTRYRLARPFFQPALACVSRFWVQSEAEKKRFCRIGADPKRITVVANLKFDAALEPGPAPGPCLARGPVIVAGSTHAPEEDWLMDASVALRRDFPGLLLVLAPRHPRRTAAICSAASGKVLSAIRFSEIAGQQVDSDILILDSMGVLPSFYRLADIAVIGGSLANCGGHNLLEPAALARCIVMGPHYEHFEDIVDDFRRADALLLLSHPRDLFSGLHRLLADSDLRVDLGRKARAAVESRAGSADQYARGMASLLNRA